MNNKTIVEVRGLEALKLKLARLAQVMPSYLVKASTEVSNELLDNTVGLRKYPPETKANRPPTPYYIRGTGMQYKSHNDLKSEQLGTRWNVEKYGTGARVYNTASYAEYVHGEKQNHKLAEYGWRKISDVFEKKVPTILNKIDAWINKALIAVGLK